jgi:hypothetical protein
MEQDLATTFLAHLVQKSGDNPRYSSCPSSTSRSSFPDRCFSLESNQARDVLCCSPGWGQNTVSAPSTRLRTFALKFIRFFSFEKCPFRLLGSRLAPGRGSYSSSVLHLRLLLFGNCRFRQVQRRTQRLAFRQHVCEKPRPSERSMNRGTTIRADRPIQLPKLPVLYWCCTGNPVVSARVLALAAARHVQSRIILGTVKACRLVGFI